MSAINIIFSDVKWNPENQISVVETKSGSISVDLWQTKILIDLLPFLSRKLHKNYQMSDKINLHI